MNRPDEHSLRQPRSLLRDRCLLGAVAIAVLAVTTVIGLGASGWIGRPFPGFFVFPNRVIASVGRTSWSGIGDGVIYQRAVVAIDGVPVTDGAAAYRQVAFVGVAQQVPEAEEEAGAMAGFN